MVEYVPIHRECCDEKPTPTRAILSLVMILNHDIKEDGKKQGFWGRYTEDKLETCPVCDELVYGHSVIETSCLHRFHYDCLLHSVAVHKDRFCPECDMRIF
jgi:hypothetical protein